MWVNRGKSDGLGVRKHEFSISKAVSTIVSQRRKDSPSQQQSSGGYTVVLVYNWSPPCCLT